MSRNTGTRPSVFRSTLYGAFVFIVAVIGGHLVNRYVQQVVITSLLKYAIGIIGIAWVFSLTVYNKLSDVTDLSGLDFRQHRNVEVEIRSRLQWFWLRAFFLGLLAFTMYVPTILSEAKLASPDWIFEAAFGALALALFSLRCLWTELEEIRELRSYVKEIERREKERVDQVKILKDGLKDEWKPDPRLNGFRNFHRKKLKKTKENNEGA